MCSIKWVTGKLLNYKDIRENLCGREDVFLSVPADSDLGRSLTFESAPCVSPLGFFTVWEKRRNFANLFGCCTFNNTSLSLKDVDPSI